MTPTAHSATGDRCACARSLVRQSLDHADSAALSPSSSRAARHRRASPGVASLSVTDVRRLWPEVLEEVKGKRRFTWILLSQNAQVAELRNGTLLLGMSNAGARDSFARGGNEDVLREAIVVVMGADFAIETMVDPSATSRRGHRVRRRPYRSRRAAASAPRASATRSHQRRPERHRGGPGCGREPRRQRPGRERRVAYRAAGAPPRRGDHRRGGSRRIGWAGENLHPERPAMIPEGDMSGLLAQAQAMQEQLLNAQQELAEMEIEGSAGGGW